MLRLLPFSMLFVLAGCPGGGEATVACPITDSVGAEVAVGVGIANFTELSAGQTVPLIAGFQGGQHLEPGYRFSGLDTEQRYTISLRDPDSGNTMARSITLETMAAHHRDEGETFLRRGDFMPVDIDRVGREAELEVCIEDASGRAAGARVRIVIGAPE